jgi:hypothetical protein
MAGRGEEATWREILSQRALRIQSHFQTGLRLSIRGQGGSSNEHIFW